MHDEEGQKALINALREKGVEFEPIDEEELQRDFDFIKKAFQDTEKEDGLS